jgi:hypothetical protein
VHFVFVEATEEKAGMVDGRLRIPCGNGFVSLPAMSGIG